MDEGDRSDRGDEPDRKTGSADSDTGNNRPSRDGPTDDEPTDDEPTDDELAGDSFGDDFDDGFTGDDPNGGDANNGDTSETSYETTSEAGFDIDTGASDDEPSRTYDDRRETGRAETEASRGRTETDRGRDAAASDNGLLHRVRHDREGPLMWIREMLSSVAIVFVIGLILFGVSGVWPPMVAVESGSMEPNMEVGDLVFVTEPGRLGPDAADNDIGVVTHETGETVDYRTFGSYGSVVIYRPPGRTASPIIHRAMFHVEEGENWHDRADDRYHSAADCGELTHCPAPHDGFITLGDNNGNYDQASGLAAPVRADWVKGVARVRVPYLGYVRLIATGQADLGDVLATNVAIQIEGVGVDGVSGGGAFDSPATVSGTKAIVSGGNVTTTVAG